jgi:hypothetical protein
MYLDVKVKLSNKFWARYLVDTVAMRLKCNSTPPFRVDSRQPLPYRIMEGLLVIRAESGTMKGSPGLETKYSSIAPGLPRQKVRFTSRYAESFPFGLIGWNHTPSAASLVAPASASFLPLASTLL